MEYMKIEARAEWAPDENDWLIPNVEYTGNVLKEQKEQIKKATGKIGNGMGENLLGFEDSEDEDYEAEATKRVNEAITSILVEEEGEMLEQAPYVPPEK